MYMYCFISLCSFQACIIIPAFVSLFGLGIMAHKNIKGELNPKIKLDLNDSFCTLINKYNPHIF